MSAWLEHRRKAKLMGSAFEFIVVAHEEHGAQWLDAAIDEVIRIEELLTEFKTTSQTSRINQLAGIRPAQVDEEVVSLVERCLELSRLTQGAFDVSASLLKNLYNFKGGDFVFPDPDQIRLALRKTGGDKIKIRKPNSVFLTVPGMHIGFGGIGKGYAADKVKSKLVGMGVENALINASGDLTAWGKRADLSPWKVGIADPEAPERILLWIPIDGMSVATSGDYEQYFEKDGIRYSHTINPRTGKPVSGIKSVTIVSRSAELSDALATAVTIMGVEVGLHFIEQLPQTHALIIDDHNKLFTSSKLSIIFNEE